MSLTRYLPIPSDRMGIVWTLLQIKDAVVLEYGPAGTSAYSRKNFSTPDMSLPGKLFTTQLSESELVLGDDARLEGKIKELDEKLSPSVIFVMASSVSAVIGYDVEGVCRYLENDVKAQLIIFPQGGFGGDFSSGLQAAYTKLVDELAVKDSETKDCFNILGVSAMTSHGSGDACAISQWMLDNFGLKPHAVLSCNTELEKISTMASAKINIVLSYEGLKAAQLLQERFGTPYVYGYPVSCGDEEKFFKAVSEKISPIKTVTFEKPAALNEKAGKIAVCATYDVLVGMEQYAVEAGLEIEFLLCSHSLRDIENPSEKVIYCKTEKERIQLFKSLNDTTVIGEDGFSPVINDSNTVISLSARGNNKQPVLLLNHKELLK